MSLATARAIPTADTVVAMIAAMTGTGLTFTPVRVWSFGFPDSELNTLRVVARPFEMERDAGEALDEDHLYTIQVGVRKMVNRKDISNIDSYFNLMIAIAKLFTIGKKIDISGGGTAEIMEVRHSPLFYRYDRDFKGMDDVDPTVRFASDLMLVFKEWVDE